MGHPQTRIDLEAGEAPADRKDEAPFETRRFFHMKTIKEAHPIPMSRRDFVRTASLAATTVASGLGLSAATGQPAPLDPAPAMPGGRAGGMEPDAAFNLAKAPLSAIAAHVCGLHFYSDDLSRQVIAHHYCSHRSMDVMQCVIYDSDRNDARLVGIEYIISAKLFAALSDEEKRLWHSHAFEVKSGQLTAPDLSAAGENALMNDLVGTYGKAWYTWQVDRGDQVPRHPAADDGLRCGRSGRSPAPS